MYVKRPLVFEYQVLTEGQGYYFRTALPFDCILDFVDFYSYDCASPGYDRKEMLQVNLFSISGANLFVIGDGSVPMSRFSTVVRAGIPYKIKAGGAIELGVRMVGRGQAAPIDENTRIFVQPYGYVFYEIPNLL